ncbi:nuclear transport factor 2 family protein [Emcibacter sp. SYSU 3D8]|uniref:nuclear transport factor 2 family protein n=1 Tax=Emcibacter sp. SYSU 3D8 TaxID=3133969 RepID=UPI0031FE7638
MTIEELLEIEEIKNLRHLYALYLDSGEIRRMVDLFLPDGVAEWPEHMGGYWSGHDQMFENWTKVYKDADLPFAHLHIATNPFIRITGPDSANGRYYALSLHTTEKEIGDAISVIGVHDDVYRKVDGKWFFEKTRYDFLWPVRRYQGFRTPI